MLFRSALAVGLLAGAIACTDRSLEVSLNSAVKVRDVEAGSGPEAREGNVVRVHYDMRLPDGSVVLDTRRSSDGHIFRIGDGTVIPGMDLAVRGMRRGGVREAEMMPAAHYGRHGYANGRVPENTTLHFTIEMLLVGN